MKRSTKHLDGLDAFGLYDAIMAELGDPTDDEIEAGVEALRAAQPAIAEGIAAALDELDASDDLAALLDELETPEAIELRAMELDAINTRRERIIRKHYGSGR